MTQPSAGTPGRVEIRRDSSGKYRFRITAGNGELLAVGEPYGSRSAALHAADRVLASSPRIEILRDEAGKYRWRMKAVNGETLAVGQRYDNRKSAQHAAATVLATPFPVSRGPGDPAKRDPIKAEVRKRTATIKADSDSKSVAEFGPKGWARLRQWLARFNKQLVAMLVGLVLVNEAGAAVFGSWSILGLFQQENSVTQAADEDPQLILEGAQTTEVTADFELRYRVASPDLYAGPVRLFLQISAGDAGPSDNLNSPATLTAYIKLGETQLAADVVSVPLDARDGRPVRIAQEASSWSPGSDNGTSTVATRVFSQAIGPHGLVLGSPAPDVVVEGAMTVRLVRDLEASLGTMTFVRNAESEWSVRQQARPGDVLEFLIRAENLSQAEVDGLVFGCNLADHLQFVPGSATLVNTANPNGIGISDSVYQGGVNVGPYSPGSVAYVSFEVRVDNSAQFETLGVYTLTTAGVVRGSGTNEYFNTAVVDVTVDD